MSRSRTRPPLELANVALAFVLELAALAGFALLAAWVPDGWLRLAAGVVAMAVFVALWAQWAAPRAKRRLEMPALLVFKIAIFAVAALGFFASGQWVLCGVFVVLSAINFGLMGYFRHF
jgi:uncharacterized membrane protein YfcA